MSTEVRKIPVAERLARYAAERKRLATTWTAPTLHLLTGTYPDRSIDEVDQRVHPEPMPEFDYYRPYNEIPIECCMAIAAVEEDAMRHLRASLDNFCVESPDWWKEVCLRMYELPTLREERGIDAMEKLDPEATLSDEVLSAVIARSLDQMNRKNQPIYSAEFAMLVKDAASRAPNIPAIPENYPPLLRRAIHVIYIWTLMAGTATIRVSGVALASILEIDRRAGIALLEQMVQTGWLRLIRRGKHGSKNGKVYGNNPVSTWRWKGYMDHGKLYLRTSVV